jgi:hypothetical protein
MIGREQGHWQSAADAPHPLTLLCARDERSRGRAAEKRDELAAPEAKCHLIHPAGRAT